MLVLLAFDTTLLKSYDPMLPCVQSMKSLGLFQAVHVKYNHVPVKC